MIIAKSVAGAVFGLLALASFAPTATAASPMTTGFMANLSMNVAFLDKASRLVADRSHAAGIRAYARSTAQESSMVAETLTEVAPATRLAAADADGLVTGRSVSSADTASKAANGRPALGSMDLDRLAASSGGSFDDLYWKTQLDALSQIESDYRTYISHGDDPVLVTMARRELPVVMRRLAALTKI